jgi:spermidine dehydrogenase
MTYSDKELGMGRRITRRDFMNGVAMSIGATAIPHGLHAQAAMGATEAQNAPGYYPPVKTGMRGTHDGSYTVAHAVRDGDFWDHAGAAESTGESYDLVVVGCGISGLASARFYRQAAGPNARVLLLDPLDDFGGHAKRNEFNVSDREPGAVFAGGEGSGRRAGYRCWELLAGFRQEGVYFAWAGTEDLFR